MKSLYLLPLLMLMAGCGKPKATDAPSVVMVSVCKTGQSMQIGANGEVSCFDQKYVEPVVEVTSKTTYRIKCPKGYALNPSFGPFWVASLQEEEFDHTPDVSNDVCIFQQPK